MCLFIIAFIPLTILNSEEIDNERVDFLEKIILNIEKDEYLEMEEKNVLKEEKFLHEYSIKEGKSQIEDLRLDDILKDNLKLNIFSIPLAKYFLKLSSYAYCSQEEMQKQNCCPELLNQDEWSLFTEKIFSYDEYNFAVLMNKKYKKIVVTFPGTRSSNQLIKELVFSSGVAFNGDSTEKIMSYSKTLFTYIKTELEKTLDELLLNYKDFQFIFTGHSLGGSMAAISLLNSLKYGNFKNLQESPVLITYGQPRVGNDVFANEVMKYVPIVYRVTRYGDIVTNNPACFKGFDANYKFVCKTILPGNKFDKNFTMNDNLKRESEFNYYQWHTGGWIHFSDDMSTYEDCGKDYGENFPNEKCSLSLNLDSTKHQNYFGANVSKICSSR